MEKITPSSSEITDKPIEKPEDIARKSYLDLGSKITNVSKEASKLGGEYGGINTTLPSQFDNIPIDYCAYINDKSERIVVGKFNGAAYGKSEARFIYNITNNTFSIFDYNTNGYTIKTGSIDTKEENRTNNREKVIESMLIMPLAYFLEGAHYLLTTTKEERNLEGKKIINIKETSNITLENVPLTINSYTQYINEANSYINKITEKKNKAQKEKESDDYLKENESQRL